VEAAQRLTLAVLPFMFFADAATDRGVVVFRRHYGSYGLLAWRP
jgi:hypothetical protein